MMKFVTTLGLVLTLTVFCQAAPRSRRDSECARGRSGTVCASNGNSYNDECDVEEEAKRTGQNVLVSYYGSCRQAPRAPAPRPAAPQAPYVPVLAGAPVPRPRAPVPRPAAPLPPLPRVPVPAPPNSPVPGSRFDAAYFANVDVIAATDYEVGDSSSEEEIDAETDVDTNVAGGVGVSGGPIVPPQAPFVPQVPAFAPRPRAPAGAVPQAPTNPEINNEITDYEGEVESDSGSSSSEEDTTEFATGTDATAVNLPVIPQGFPTSGAAAPARPRSPFLPAAPVRPPQPRAPTVPRAPVPAPRVPVVPAAPQVPYVPAVPQQPYAPVVPQRPFAPVIPQQPYAPVAPQRPSVPVVPQQPYNPRWPQYSGDDQATPYVPNNRPYSPGAQRPTFDQGFYPSAPVVPAAPTYPRAPSPNPPRAPAGPTRGACTRFDSTGRCTQYGSTVCTSYDASGRCLHRGSSGCSGYGCNTWSNNSNDDLTAGALARR